MTANITYWQQHIAQIADGNIHEFNQEQANLILAIKLGLDLPALQKEATRLLLQVFPLIEPRGFWEKWASLLETAVTLEIPNNSTVHIRLLNRWGQMLRLMRQASRAIEIHQSAAQAARTANDQQLVAETWFNLSADYRQLRDYEQARSYGQKALATFANSPDCEQWQAAMLNTLGLIELSSGNLDSAEERLRQSLTLWRQFDEPTEQARVLNGLALTLQRKNQFEAALYYYQQAVEHLKSTTSELDKVEVYLNSGALYFEQQLFDKAEICFRQAHAITLSYPGNFYFRAMIANNLGNVLLEQNQFDEAEVYLQRSQALWQQIGDNLMLANTVGTLAGLCARQGKPKAALAYYDKALTLLQDFGHDAWARKLESDFIDEKTVVIQRLKSQGGYRPDSLP